MIFDVGEMQRTKVETAKIHQVALQITGRGWQGQQEQFRFVKDPGKAALQCLLQWLSRIKSWEWMGPKLHLVPKHQVPLKSLNFETQFSNHLWRTDSLCYSLLTVPGNPWWLELLLSFYSWGNWGLVRQSSFPWMVQLVVWGRGLSVVRNWIKAWVSFMHCVLPQVTVRI